MRLTNRPAELIALGEAYAKEQGLFRTDGAPEPLYSDKLELDLSTVEPSLAGPKRPQDRLPLGEVKKNFLGALGTAQRSAKVTVGGKSGVMRDGAVAIAAITSCTNTSNPDVLIAAGLVAKKAVERGLSVPAWVKTSLSPGSKVVMDYLQEGGCWPTWNGSASI